MTYIRSDDCAVMIQVAPHNYVNADVLAALGRITIAARDEVRERTTEPEAHHRDA